MVFLICDIFVFMIFWIVRFDVMGRGIKIDEILILCNVNLFVFVCVVGFEDILDEIFFLDNIGRGIIWYFIEFI